MSHAPDYMERSSVERMARIPNLDQLHRGFVKLTRGDIPEGLRLKGSTGGLFDPSARAVQNLRDDRDELTRRPVSTWRKRREYDSLRAWTSLLSRKKTPP